ncbi:unnamed protein product [Penicillium bialowiezense]
MNYNTSFAGMSSFENGDFQQNGLGSDNGNGNYRGNQNRNRNRNYGRSPNYQDHQGKWNPDNGNGYGNVNQSPNPNYKGKNFNPNYRGKNFNPNHHGENFNPNHQGENFNPSHQSRPGGFFGEARNVQDNRGYRGNQNCNGNGNDNWNPNSNPNYKGKKFNPNYRGKNFNPNHQGPRGGSVERVRRSPEPHLDGQGPFSGAQVNRRNRNRNRKNNQSLPPKFKAQEEDILMFDAPPPEPMDYYPTDVEMTDAPALSVDPKVEVFNAGVEAVQQIVGISIAVASSGSCVPQGKDYDHEDGSRSGPHLCSKLSSGLCDCQLYIIHLQDPV